MVWLLTDRTGSSLSAFQSGPNLFVVRSAPTPGIYRGAFSRLAYVKDNQLSVTLFSWIYPTNLGQQLWRENLWPPDGQSDGPRWFMVCPFQFLPPACIILYCINNHYNSKGWVKTSRGTLYHPLNGGFERKLVAFFHICSLISRFFQAILILFFLKKVKILRF